MKFIEPPYRNHWAPKYADHINEAINIDLVKSVKVGRENYYPDNKGIPTIDFTFSDKEVKSWYMHSDEDAEKHYGLLVGRKIKAKFKKEGE